MDNSLITLINPPKLYSHSASFYVGRGGAPPLNLAYLGGAISKAGFDYEVIDSMATNNKYYDSELGIHIHGLALEDIANSISKGTRLIGITSMFSNEFLIIKKLVRLVKKINPDVIIVLGGEHASAFAIPTLKYEKEIDYIFYGESELSFVEFLRAYQAGSSVEEVSGIYFRKNDEIVKTKAPIRITEIDNLKPEWDKIPVDYYLSEKLSYSRVGVRSMPYLATRGCPYKCTFCSNEEMWGNRYVKKSVKEIISELTEYKRKYNIEHVDFQDLSTSVNRAWFKELLTEMMRALPGLTWEMTVGTRSEILDREILELLLKSGTTQLTYAPETGSPQLAKKIKKSVNYKKMFQSIKIANQLGMDVKAHMIIGFPEERIIDLFKTIMMAMKMGLTGVKGVSIYTFSPYPGSEIFNKLYDQNNFSKQEYENYLFYQMINSAGARVFSIKNLVIYPKEEIYTFIGNLFMLVCYFLSMIRFPHRFFNLLLNPLRGTPKNPIEMGLFNLMKKLSIKSGK